MNAPYSALDPQFGGCGLCLGRGTANGYGPMQWRTALRVWRAVLWASFGLRVLDEASGQHRNVISIENIDVAGFNVDQSDLILAAASAAALASAAGGHEVQFLIRQFDRVSKVGHLFHG